MSHTKDLIREAALVYADHYQFPAGEVLRFPAVHSRFMAWGLRGSGIVNANGRRVDLTPGRFVLLPWEHSILYRAADHDPFQVGGLHVVPVHAMKHPIEFHVAHGPDRHLWGVPYRHDAPLESLSQVVVGELSEHLALSHLAEYAVACYERKEPEEAEMRQLGRLLLLEFNRAANEAKRNEEIPAVLQALAGWVSKHLDQAIDLDKLAQLARCSRSTVQRMIRKHLKQSALEWIIGLKMSRAKQLLISTNLSISEVGRQVGLRDPYYFSRLFKSKTGESPRRCRARGRFL